MCGRGLMGTCRMQGRGGTFSVEWDGEGLPPNQTVHSAFTPRRGTENNQSWMKWPTLKRQRLQIRGKLEHCLEARGQLAWKLSTREKRILS